MIHVNRAMSPPRTQTLRALARKQELFLHYISHHAPRRVILPTQLCGCNQPPLLSEMHCDYTRMKTLAVTANNYVDDDEEDDDDINDTSCNILSPASMYCI